MRYPIFFGMVLLGGLALLNIGFQKPATAPPSREAETAVGSVQGVHDVAEKVQDPFYNMTIPYLREREFASQLAEMTLLSESSNYQSYLTSYTSDGLTINGLLTIPSGQRPAQGWPAVVFVHGYIAPNVYRTTERYEGHVDALVQSGLVVFKIDLRGHDQSEGSPGGAYYASDYVIDALNAISALQQAEFVNPSAVGMWGHSMAGNVAFRSLVARQDIPAVVVWAGAGYTYTDFQKYGVSDSSYRAPVSESESQRRRVRLRELHGNFKAEDPFWAQVTPVNYFEGVSGSIQVHHAVDDAVVNIGYGRDLMTVLDKTSIPHELYEYSTGGHNLTGTSFTLAMERTVAFFRTHLQ